MIKMENAHCIGCCTTVNPTFTTNIITMGNGSKMRGIVHSMQERGKARLIFTDNFTQLKGILLNNCEESISITGTSSSCKEDSAYNILQMLPPSSSADAPKSVQRIMTITVVDGEVGQEFCIKNVEIKITARTVSLKNGTNHSFTPQLVVEINSPSIKFSTEEVLIGNRADVEIRKFFAYDRLIRAGSRSMNHPLPTEERNNNALYVGLMSINIVRCQRIVSSVRRMSVCDGCTTNIIEQSNDFLV